MNVTRDVIYDLLPGYFSGDLSPDTRALVDEFLRQDPEFSKMMERVRTAYGDARPLAASPVSRDKEAFERARAFLQKRSELRGYVVAFGLAALFVFIIVLIRASGAVNLGPLAIAVALAGAGAVAGIQLYKMSEEGPGRAR